MVHFEQWEGFEGRIWREEVNVRDFIQKNYKPYAGDESFLAGPRRRRINSGAFSRNCKKRSERRAACWIWRRTSFPA